MHAIVEIMGRRTRAGLISDAQMGGATLLRIEHPTAMDHTGTEPRAEYYAPSAIFGICPCSEEEAVQVAGWAWPDRPGTPELSSGVRDLIDDDTLHPDDTDDEWGSGF